jgi:hypothetical protein
MGCMITYRNVGDTITAGIATTRVGAGRRLAVGPTCVDFNR